MAKPMSPPRRMPDDTFVAVDIACLGCGYNLKTMPVDANCPECNRPVEFTLHPPVEHMTA